MAEFRLVPVSAAYDIIHDFFTWSWCFQVAEPVLEQASGTGEFNG